MNLINILRFFRGYVRFSIKGGFIERFINLCASDNIRIWNLEPHIERTEGYILAKNFHRLRKAVKRSGVKIKIEKKIGLPFFISKHRERKLLFIGIFFYIAFIFFMNQFVWFIEVEGTNTVSHNQIISSLEQYGLRIGSFAPKVDSIALNRNGVNHFNGKLMWMSVNIKGSKAVVEVRDYIDEHEDTTFGPPCNIVADFDGTILSVEIINGDREVHAGNAVKKGDLLISGVIQNRDMSADYLEARGRITALHSVNYEKLYHNSSVAYERYDGYKKRYRLNLLGFSLPLYFSFDNCDEELIYDEFLTADNNVLPFGITAVTKINSKYETDCSYVLLAAIDAYTKEYHYQFRNTNILNSDTSVIKNDKGYIIKTDSECIDFIGVKSLIYVDSE